MSETGRQIGDPSRGFHTRRINEEQEEEEEPTNEWPVLNLMPGMRRPGATLLRTRFPDIPPLQQLQLATLLGPSKFGLTVGRAGK